MRFTPKIIKENVNVSRSSPLRELFVLLTGILGVVLVVYIVLGQALDVLIARMPEKLEQAAGGVFAGVYRLQSEEPDPEQSKLQLLLDELTQYYPDDSTRFTVRIHQSPDINALAIPGNYILVFSGLLEEVNSENELAMVLAHELGHFAQRDHLRGLGRGLVLVFISGIVFGADSAIADFTQRTLLTADLRFSRQQEAAADSFALKLLHHKYGHVGGALDFLERLEEKRELPHFLKFLSSHPDPEDRMSLLRQEIGLAGYAVEPLLPWERLSK
ncbi:M48 family metallopeptidase [Candidatus Omnitrophota bacterium]